MAVTPPKCGAAKAFAEISKRVVLNGDVALQLHQQDAMTKASIVEWSSAGTIASAVGHSIGGAMAALLEVVEEYQRREPDWPGTPEQRRESDRRALAEVAETLRKIPPWTTETRLRLGGRVWTPLTGPDETGVIVVSEDEPEDALFIDIGLFDQVEVLGDRGAAPPPATSTMTLQLCEVGGELDGEQMVPVLLRCGLETARQLGALLYRRVGLHVVEEDDDGGA